MKIAHLTLTRPSTPSSIPEEINSRFYGCGNPIPLGIEGLTVLDLGSGSGRDCYVASKLVGPNGHVIGVDMTPELSDISRKFIDGYTERLGYPKANLEFLSGNIEFLDKAGIKPDSLDIVISNCVVNLSPDKPRVLQQVWNSLKVGGEFFFSDVYCDRRLSEKARNHEVLFGECIAGALYIEDFKRICHKVGFLDVRSLSSSEIAVEDPELKEVVGDAKFYSILYRLFKVPDLESTSEDYGQTAIYKGTIQGHEDYYLLDDHNMFITGKEVEVSGNTAQILKSSWLSKFFEVKGDRSTHKGLFDPSKSSVDQTRLVNEVSESMSCCAPKKQETGSKGSTSCCGPKKQETESKGSTSCCGPKKQESGCCAPKTEKSGCCGPKQSSEQTAQSSEAKSGCCGPKQSSEQTAQSSEAKSGCCGPKQSSEQTAQSSEAKSGCCGPKKSGCC